MAVDAELATALKQAKTKPMFFAFVAKGTESKLLVNKKKISPKDTAEAKKDCGGGTIYKGRCRGDDGTLVFEVGKKVPDNLSALTKKIIKQDAGLMFEVEYRIATDLEDEETETDGEQETGSPDELADKWKDNLAAWTPAINAAIAAKGPSAADIAKLLAQATALSKPGGDMVQALAKLTECHTLATAPAPTSEKPTTTDPAADWKKKLAECSPAIKAAMTAKGPNAADIAKLLAQATALAKPGGDMFQALSKLNECHELATEKTEDPAAEWERRVTAMEPKILAAQKTRPGDAKWMTMFMSAQDLGSNGDFAKSFAILDKLDGLLGAPTKGEESTTGGADPGGDFKKNLATWTPKIKEAMAAKGPNAADIAKLLAQATSLAKPGGDMPLALEKLTECHELALKDTVTPEQTEFTQRLKALTADYEKIKDSQAAKDGNFAAGMAKMQELSSKGQYGQALKLLEVVEPKIRSAARVGGVEEEIKKQTGGNVVRFRTCRLEWDAARKKAEQQIGAFVAAVLAEEDLQKDPQFLEISANLDKLKDQLAPFGEELYDLLDKAMVATTEEERTKQNQACVVQIEKYQKLLAGAAALEAMEDTSFGSFTIYSALSDAIDKMSGLLA